MDDQGTRGSHRGRGWMGRGSVGAHSKRRAERLRPRLALAATLGLVLAACGTSVSPPPATSPSPSPLASPPASLVPSPTPSAAALVTPSPSPSASPSASTSAGDLAHTPFTVLLLGVDSGYRTDAVIVVGVDPVRRRVTYASVPRDTIDMPLPDGGRYGQRKINTFYSFARANPTRYPEGPAKATMAMVGKLLGIRVDFYATTTFDGFENLVDAMGGVSVDVPETIVDPKYQVTTRDIGVSFRAGPQRMAGSRALIYVRTRGADSDFDRSRRQQVFLTAAGNQLLSRQNLLKALLAAQPRNMATNFPLAQAPGLLVAFATDSGSPDVDGTVLGPRKYSDRVACPCGYALEPDLAAMREAAARLFPWAVTP